MYTRFYPTQGNNAPFDVTPFDVVSDQFDRRSSSGGVYWETDRFGRPFFQYDAVRDAWFYQVSDLCTQVPRFIADWGYYLVEVINPASPGENARAGSYIENRDGLFFSASVENRYVKLAEDSPHLPPLVQRITLQAPTLDAAHEYYAQILNREVAPSHAWGSAELQTQQ